MNCKLDILLLRILKSLFLLIVILFLLPLSVMSQEIIDIDYKLQTDIPLKVSEINQIRSLDMIWINDEKLVFREDRQVTMFTNPDNPSIRKDERLTNFLWDFGEGKYSNITYIEELGVIILVEETPDPSLQVFNLDGVYVKTILDFITGNDYKAKYLKTVKKILILANKNLILYDYDREESNIIAENVYDFKYFQESNEIFVLLNTDDLNIDDNRREFDLSIVNPKNTEVQYSEDNITDFKYYPESNKLFITKSDYFNSAKIVEINYPKNPNNRKEFKRVISYKDFLTEEVIDRITERLKNKLYFNYISELDLYIWAEPEQKSNQSNGNNPKTLYISDNPFQETDNEYKIEGVLAYSYNPINQDIILFYENGSDYSIEKVSISEDNLSEIFTVDNRLKISDNAFNTKRFFIWNHETNIIFYTELVDGNVYIIAYDLNSEEKIFTKGPVSDVNNIFIELVDEEIIAISYINQNNTGISELYHLPLDKNTVLMENTYYSIPASTYGTVATIRRIDDSNGGAGTLALSFYESILTYEDIDKEPDIIGSFGIGAKIGGAFNTTFGGYNFPDFGFNIIIFGNMELYDSWLIELGFGFENRNLTYSSDRSDWLLQNVRIIANLLSLSVLAKYKVNSLYYFPFGLRGNYSIYTIGETENSSGVVFPFEFEEYTNKFTIDIMGGAGINFIINPRTDVFTELMLVFNVYPPMILPSIVTGPGLTEGDRSNGFYFGIILNLGVTAYKFGIVDEAEDQNISIGPVNVGFKVGVGTSSLIGITGNTLGITYEPAIFADIALLDNWLFEVDLGFYGRRMGFSSDVNTGLTNDITVITNLFSTSFLLKYKFLAFHFPFGLKINYLINGYFNSNGVPYEFEENINALTYDFIVGGGAGIQLSGNVDIIAELLLIFNLSPAFFKDSFITTAPGEGEKEGRFWGIQLNIGANVLTFGDDDKETIELDIGGFSIGGKIGGSIDTLLAYSATINLGFEFIVFGGLNITENWFAEIDILYGRRNIEYDTEKANIVTEKFVVASDIIGIQLGGRYIFQISEKQIGSENSMGIFIPFGLRSNINLRSVVHINSTDTLDFSENVNNISIDALGGIGYIYYLDETKDIFAELLFIVNLVPEFFGTNIYTLNNNGEEIVGRFIGFQLNLGFTFWKF